MSHANPPRGGSSETLEGTAKVASEQLSFSFSVVKLLCDGTRGLQRRRQLLTAFPTCDVAAVRGVAGSVSVSHMQISAQNPKLIHFRLQSLKKSFLHELFVQIS